MPLPREQFLPASAKAELAGRATDLKTGGLPELLRKAGKEMYNNPVVNTAISLTPGAGDLQSGLEALRSAREGDWTGAALNGVGVLPFVPALGGIVSSKLSKVGDARDAASNIKQVLEQTGGKMPYEDIAQMNRNEFNEFYDYVAPHHQGKFDRLLRSYAPQYEDLPETMRQYAQDFKYENPRITARFGSVKPDDQVTLYRSVTATDPDKTIVPGDWVALEKQYADMHGHLGVDAPRMMEMKVPAKDVRWAGTSADEYFYVPSGQVNQNIGSKFDALQEYVKQLRAAK